MSRKSSSWAGGILKFVLMAVGLGVVGIAFGALGALIGGRIIGGSDSSGFAALGLAIGGVFIGYPAGIIIGLILIRKLLHQKGSLWLGMLGAVLGAGLTVALAEPLNLNSNPNMLFGALLLSVPVLGLGGYLVRRG